MRAAPIRIAVIGTGKIARERHVPTIAVSRGIPSRRYLSPKAFLFKAYRILAASGLAQVGKIDGWKIFTVSVHGLVWWTRSGVQRAP